MKNEVKGFWFLSLTVAALFMMAGCKKETPQTLAAKIAGNYFVADTSILQNPPCYTSTDIISNYAIVIAETADNKVTITNFNGCNDVVNATVSATTVVATDDNCVGYNIAGTINGDKITFSYVRGGGPCSYTSKAVATKQQ